MQMTSARFSADQWHMSYIPSELRRLVISRAGNLGKTTVGRATIAALKMNRPLMLAIREEEALIGRHPPPERRF